MVVTQWKTYIMRCNMHNDHCGKLEMIGQYQEDSRITSRSTTRICGNTKWINLVASNPLVPTMRYCVLCTGPLQPWVSD